MNDEGCLNCYDQTKNRMKVQKRLDNFFMGGGGKMIEAMGHSIAKV